MLYDLTSSDVGGAEESDKAPRVQPRSSARLPQVVLAVFVNVAGFPLSYKTFDVNRTDVTTLETVMCSTCARCVVNAPRFVISVSVISAPNFTSTFSLVPASGPLRNLR